MSQVRWDANAYEAVSRPQLQWGRALLDSHSWRGDEAVLDAGCGTGVLAEEILQRAPKGRVVALDSDPAMLEKARQRLSKHGGRAKVVEGDIQHLEMSDAFDVIFSNAVLHWVPDHDAVFATFLRHLKPGGQLLIQCGGEGNLDRIRTLAREVTRLPAFGSSFLDWTPPWHYEDDASTQERLLIAGVVKPKVMLQPMPTPFPDASSFRSFAETVVLLPYLQRLSSDSQRNAFLDQFMRGVGVSKEELVFDYVRLNIRGQRSPHH